MECAGLYSRNIKFFKKQTEWFSDWYRHTLFLFFIATFIFLSHSEGADISWLPWKVLGLEGKPISSIAYLQKSNMVVAGGRGELQVLQNESTAWIKIPFQVAMALNAYSIVDIAESKQTGDIVVALQRNRMDGYVAIGRKISASPFFSITFANHVSSVQSVTFESDNANVLYYGSGDTIKRCELQSDGHFISASIIGGAEGYFGSVNPICSDLVVPGLSKKLLVGGYDSINEASVGTGALLEFQGSSLALLKKHKITTFSERSKFSGVTEESIFFGTRDSGVVRYSSYQNDWLWLPLSPPESLSRWTPVKKLVAYEFGVPTVDKYFPEATVCTIILKTGIYYTLTAYSQFFNWKKAPALPLEPLCICCNSKNANHQITYYIGTAKGVYHSVTEMTGLGTIPHDLKNAGNSVFTFSLSRGHSGAVSIVNNSTFSGQLSIQLLNSKGMLVDEDDIFCKPGINPVTFSRLCSMPAKGIYFLRIANKDRSVFVQNTFVYTR